MKHVDPTSSSLDNEDKEYREVSLKTMKAGRWFFIASLVVLCGIIIYYTTVVLNILSIPIGIILWSVVIVFCLRGIVDGLEKRGANRLIGTIIGGFVGMGFFYLYQLFPPFFPGSELWSESLFLFIGIIVMNLASQFFHANDAIPPASVVFYIVMLNTPENEYISYALNRMFDTGFGVILSILINVALPREFFERHMSRRRLEEEISALELERLEYDLSVEKKLTALEELESQKSNSSREALS